MPDRTFDELVQDLSRRRRLREPSPVVLLGAGASIESGVGMMGKLYELVGVQDFASFVTYIESRDENERYRLLAEFLQNEDPGVVTPGYTALAELCEAVVFDVVLTTNLDPLLDDALAAARLRRRDYLLFINGIARAERLALMLRSNSPRVKVVKLHGDLFHRFMAWTPPEMAGYLAEIGPTLSSVLQGRDVLVVGYSLRDDAVRNFVMGLGGVVWYVNPSPPPEQVRLEKSMRVVVGKDLTFETIFPKLRAELGLDDVAAPAAAKRPSVRQVVERAAAEVDTVKTTDDLMASVVGLASTTKGPPQMTGFVLAEPRVIVTDGWAGNLSSFPEGHVVIVTSNGHRLQSRIRPSGNSHPFGPALVDVPEGLRGPGLRVDSAPLAKGTRLQLAVAAGERVGLSSGLVTTGKEQRLEILPLGPVPQLVHVVSTVAPGSSGAPAVDATMRVRGFVVAGSTDPKLPDTFVLPAQRWAPSLTRSLTATPPKKRARTRPRRARRGTRV